MFCDRRALSHTGHYDPAVLKVAKEPSQRVCLSSIITSRLRMGVSILTEAGIRFSSIAIKSRSNHSLVYAFRQSLYGV